MEVRGWGGGGGGGVPQKNWGEKNNVVTKISVALHSDFNGVSRIKKNICSTGQLPIQTGPTFAAEVRFTPRSDG